MDRHKSRTIICSVAFLDIVGYSELSVARQHAAKDAFNAVVREAIDRIPEDERWILDTGDGAAIGFVGDPEDALFVAIDVRAGFAAATFADGRAYPPLRIGVHLGPVRAVHDLNGRANLIGDGINVGQRIMSFCEPNQILVSRAYHEVVSCISARHAALFRFLGARTDKHVREHVVYEVDTAGSADSEAPSADPAPVAAAPAWEPSPERVVAVEAALARAVGPLAGILSRRAMAGVAGETDWLRALAQSVPAGRPRTEFEAAVGLGGGAPAPVAPESDHPADPAIDAGAVARVEAALAGYVGPLAHVLVTRSLTRTSSLAELTAELAKEIRDPEERARFLAAAGHGVR